MFGLSAGGTLRGAVLLLTSSPSPCPPLRLDPIHGYRRILVLPHPDHQPPVRRELTIVSRISLPVRFELGSPPVGVGLRRDRVVGATVPEAPVDLHRDSSTPENDVRPTGQVPDVDPEPKSTPVELPSYRNFGSGPGRRKARHEARDDRGRRWRTNVARTHG